MGFENNFVVFGMEANSGKHCKRARQLRNQETSGGINWFWIPQKNEFFYWVTRDRESRSQAVFRSEKDKKKKRHFSEEQDVDSSKSTVRHPAKRGMMQPPDKKN
ncbi:uncharacterized protein CIMG_07796 [Coccidioides immitis RS]|uniref:Uncharacterized protein n=3 Tax=Coccidioides immitis TaxID=5501 RepID=J3K449_COCIM|nr:uncharacterized protein CIMG_07796 [Coccidioides immitis RS]EAS29050.3 hypothetical protein CIMG_07796 [Coccidioides immitis RS]KMP06161.1 hypothetical protein CIRG_05842 [Coccidioides immitis RMSCC 2394]KMU78370.1 hypothetical protein CISG_06606 [Coccidioides immitis RMSCC 3703]